MSRLSLSCLFLSSAAVLLVTAAEASAQSCAKAPSCAELGYVKTVADCADTTILYCPFDKEQVYCEDWKPCSDYKLSSCPAHAICETCSSFYKIAACEDGYKQNSFGTACGGVFSPLYDGYGNTQAIIGEIGADALAATAASKFYVGSKGGDFGQGKWYLPAIGELMNVYGTNVSAMTSGTGTSGATGANKTLINNALSTLAGKGVEAATLTRGYYWSSSEYSLNLSWSLAMTSGGRNDLSKGSYYYVRVFQLVENCFNPLTLSAGATAPQIGDVMYNDKTYGAAADYNSRKTVVGVITEVFDDGSVKIMNLKDLTFSSYNTVGNFDADNPYGGSVKYTYHTTSAKYNQDVAGVPNYNSAGLLNAAQEGN